LQELVATDAEGFKFVNYSNITALLVEAMKEQQKTIEKLEKEKEEMSNQNSDIINRLEKVEALLNSSAKNNIKPYRAFIYV